MFKPDKMTRQGAERDFKLGREELPQSSFYPESMLKQSFCDFGTDNPPSIRRPQDFQQNGEWFRCLVAGIQNYALFITDPDGFVMSWNTGAERMIGYTAREIIGQHVSRFYSKGFAGRINLLEASLAQGERERIEVDDWLLHKDGRKFWANITITPVYNRMDNPSLCFGNIICLPPELLPSKTSVETEVETAQAWAQILIEEVRECAIYLLDPLGIIKSWNKGAERITGYTAAEITGQHFSRFYPPTALTPEDETGGQYGFELQYAETQGVLEDEGWRIRKDGSKFWANVVITALRNEKGDLIGFSTMLRDVTERKDTEETLRENEKRYRIMADTAMGRSREFEALYKQLEVLNKELETFSYSVSHDLRAPLRAVSGFSHTLLEEYNENLDETGREYLYSIISEANRMSQLIDGMLTLSKLTRNEIYKDTINLTEIVEGITTQLRKQEPGRAVTLEIQQNVMAYGDMRLLRTMLQNLLDNAWKYTSLHPTALIRFGTKQEKHETVYFVQDDGAGFDMKYANKLFGVFQRLHTPQEFPGTGVGLATVQRIIHRHGGRVWVDSIVEKGATFYFTLEPEASQ